ncbi:hypothetical protein E4K72_12645 [Oxalobacteraceae bacterium OM1]|nr:hypothetical protein E4K72_12645 [Oxalobacteraceae bacterium OM1]
MVYRFRIYHDYARSKRAIVPLDPSILERACHPMLLAQALTDTGILTTCRPAERQGGVIVTAESELPAAAVRHALQQVLAQRNTEFPGLSLTLEMLSDVCL